MGDGTDQGRTAAGPTVAAPRSALAGWALFDWATERGARQFRAAVAQDNVASLAVVARLGFRRADVQLDDLGGAEIIFDLDRWPVEPVEPAGAVKP